ncbi:sugar ABC transporter permease [Photobacterium gaetbulicola]|uniref:Carbohydrate ABC transporter permease n=1 Tax=Photobacterium gaetbulicola Gung47 TaxID=658445 RepID=A0A0C5WWR7_9GAMM|nr:sugar ABC transporter permease [Photobacterium gaetbulicola]AJR09474.1 carbohydrate ABC transporter permease [Photobacterium gaetbulicola Gung47]PSU14269.1 sugar ABC transporter permease [Photobacterium gaetbulicola]
MNTFLSKFKLKDSHIGGLLASSYLGFSAIFWLYPVIWLIILSFSDWRFIGTPSFNGLNNFFDVVQDPLFWQAMWNVIRFLAYYLPIVLISSLLFAYGLSKLRYGKSFVALSFLLANVSSGVAYSIVFSKIFSQNGPVNGFLDSVFGFTIPWLTNADFAMLSIALIVTWKFVGYYGLIFYSGLSAIPKEIYSAAELDKTSPLKRLFKITLPMMNAQIIMVLVLAMTVAFGIFTEPYLITGGGPLGSTTTPMVVMYEAAFMRMEPSWAATMSIFVAVISFGLIWLIRKLFERNVEIV